MEFIAQPITTLEQAKSFIRSLYEHGLMFHFDDGAHDCLDGVTAEVLGRPRGAALGYEQTTLIDKRVIETYAFDWGVFECPIGYCIETIDAEQNR